jgi:phytanoyl-CoA hydroxylase
MEGIPGDARERFERDGFLVLDGFATHEDCDALIARARTLVTGFDPGGVASVFSSVNQDATFDDWLLGSGDAVRFFFEEEAFDAGGRLRQPKELSINKIGHALHDLDPTFERFSHTPRLAALAGTLGLEAPLVVQSMYIFKQPRIGGEVVAHQDATYLHTEPQSCIGFWFALEDATRDNGCLWALPGGHRGPLRRRFVRRPEGGVAHVELDPTPWPYGHFLPLEAPKGTLVVLHGLLPHRSGLNRSDRSRHAYTLHAVDGRARYAADNWLQRGPDLPFRGFA